MELIIREVVEKSPSPQSYLLLGDAYMSITEPERALEIYEQVTVNQRTGLMAADQSEYFTFNDPIVRL